MTRIVAAWTAIALGCTALTPAHAVPVPKPRPASANTSGAAPAPARVERAAKTPSAPPAVAATTTTPQADLTLVKSAIELIRKNKDDKATDTARGINDPLARKLVEWVLLRSENEDFDFDRFSAFTSANPSWPNNVMFRRKAEAALWQTRPADGVVRTYFASNRPVTAKGKFALARALLAQGDRAQALTFVRQAWREDSFSADVEKYALEAFGPMLTGADHKARMDRRLYADDIDEAMRAASQLGGVQTAIAKARQAVTRKASNAKALLDAVPEEGRRDAGYIYSRAQFFRRADNAADAAKVILTAPNDAQAQADTDEWWIERRVLARKLIDSGDAQSAFKIARDAAPPVKENNRVDQLFTAGWIAYRHLNDPAAAAPFFAKLLQVAEHSSSIARAHYWQGRVAETLGKQGEARTHYERGAQFATAYYGQLSRAKIGAGELRMQPAPSAARSGPPLEIVRALEILYAIDERDLVVSAIADLADKTTDVSALAAIANLAERQQDSRSLVLIGRTAVGRGLPFEQYAYPTVGLPRYQPVGLQVEPQVAYAIARQESGFHPRAVSSANALGLMQVTPAAGKTIARKLGIGFDAKRLLNDSTYNVQMGAAELGDVLESYRGSYILAFVAYNAGRGRVREWIERYGDPRDPSIDPVDWVERIPFTETRNYVQRVLENLQVYRTRFSGSPKLLIEADLRRGMITN